MESVRFPPTLVRVWLYAGVIIATSVSFVCSKSSLRVGGFVSLSHAVSGWDSAGTRVGLEMALEDVNEDPNILSEYNLTVEWKDERCGTGYSMKGLFELLTKERPLVAILGPGCSVETKNVALVSHIWNLIEIGFSSSDPTLSNHLTYANYYRVNPSQNNFNLAFKNLLHEFKWRDVWIIKETGGIFLEIENLNHTFNGTIRIRSLQSFVDPKFIPKHIRFFKESKARILYLLTYVTSARKVLCEAYKQGFYSNETQWILMGWYTEGWWKVNDTNCTGKEIKTAMGNYLAMTDMTLRENTDTTFGLKPDAFKREYLSREKLLPELVFGAFAYDAVWVLAVVLNKTDEQLRIRNNETLSDFNYSRKDVTDLIKEQLDKINITGVSGNIVFDSGRNRATDICVSQFQGEVMVRIGEFRQNRNAIYINHTKIQWKGNKIPLDNQPSISILLGTTDRQFHQTLVCASVGITMAMAFLLFNIKHRNNQFIKMSSPPLNNIIIIGAIFCYLFTVVFVIDGFHVHNNNTICLIRLMLSSVGFSLSFGTMFVKAWRVYKIFTNDKLQKTIGYLSNRCLMTAIGLMVLVDFIYILTWNKVQKINCVRQFVRRLEIDTMEHNYYTHSCVINLTGNFWFIGIFSYKVLLLIFGLFLAWQTKNVQLPGLNDSKLIALSVYNVVIFLTILFPLYMFLPKWLVEMKNNIVLFLMMFCPSVVLMVIFVPKIYHLRRISRGKVNAASSLENEVSINGVSAAVIEKNGLHNCPSCSCDVLSNE